MGSKNNICLSQRGPRPERIVTSLVAPHWLGLLHRQDGMALVLAIVLMLLVAILSVGGMATSQGELQIAANDQSAKRALAVADAGIRHAFRILGSSDANAYLNGFNDELANDGTGGALGAAAAGPPVTLDDGHQYLFFSFGGGPNDGYYIRAVDNRDDADQTTDSDQKIILVARGRVGTAEKVIESLARPPVPCALLTGTRTTQVGGNASTDNLEVNTEDGTGACVHSNGPLSINGNPTFPDGATSANSASCVGSAQILDGGCEQIQAYQPVRAMPPIPIGDLGNWVAELGVKAQAAGLAASHRRFYILDAQTGQVKQGGSCYTETTGNEISGAASNVGLCTGGVVVTAPAGIGAVGGGECVFSGVVAPGIYYCTGRAENSGQVNSPGVTIIARDSISLGSQANLSPFNTNKTSPTNYVRPEATAFTAAIDANVTLTAAEKTAFKNVFDKFKNLVLIAGQDLDLKGNNTNIVGIVLIHNEVDMNGGKTITGYVVAADGLPTYPGDPHPPTSSSLNADIPNNSVIGTNRIIFENFSTNIPEGAPAMASWNDDVRDSDLANY